MSSTRPISADKISPIGLDVASTLASKLLTTAAEMNLLELESICKSALLNAGRKTFVEKHDAQKQVAKKTAADKKMIDMLPNVSTLSATQMKNQSLRFGLEESPSTMLQRQSWAFTTTRNTFFGSSQPVDSRDYEDVVSLDILRAPISDICVIQRGEPIPEGYYRLSKTPGNKKANLNSQSGGNHIFLCIKKDLKHEAVPITALIVIFPDKNEFVPPGYFVVRRGDRACNLNTGTSAERIFLCFKKDLSGNPLCDIQVIFPTRNEEVPREFNLIEKSPTGVPANLNTGTGGGKIFLCYRQLLVQFSCLDNDHPLHLSTSGASISAGAGGGGSGRAVDDASSTLRSSGGSTGLKKDSHTSRSSSALDAMDGDFIPPPSTTLSPSSLAAQAALEEDANILSQLNEKYSKGGVSSPSPGKPALTKAPSVRTLPPAPPAFERSASNGAKGGKKGGDGDDEEGGGGGGRDDVSETHDDVDETASVDSEEEDHNFQQPEIRRSALVVDAEGEGLPRALRKLLQAILTAVYVRHGDISETAVAGLCMLLKDTDFFAKDLRGIPLSGSVTMLDLTVEAICDRFDHCQETEVDSVLWFLKVLIKHSGARLSSATVQRMFRALSFLCNYYSTRTGWIIGGYPSPCMESGLEIPAFRVLKELVCAIVAQVETTDVVMSLRDALSDETDYTGASEAFEVSRHFVVTLIEDVIDSVEVCRLCEITQVAIAKQSSSTTSSSFWKQTGALSRRLFVDAPNRMAFVALCALCKLAWHGVRTTEAGVTPRDLGSKLLALDALHEFCASAGEKMKMSKVMGYQIRRLVVPCILNNLPLALNEHRIFAKLLKLITVLWKVWRVHVRIEFANLCEQLVIRVLQASTLKVRPVFQMIVLQEVVTWFDQPHLLLEMFVNFDMDGKFVSHWNVFSHLVRAVCAIARRSSLVTGAWDYKPAGSAPIPATVLEAMTRPAVTVRDVNMHAIEEVARIAKTLMDATGHAYLIMQDSNFRSRSLNAGAGWEEDGDAEDNTGTGEGEDVGESPSGTSANRTRTDSSGTPDGAGGGGGGKTGGGGRKFSVKFRRAIHEEAEDLLKQAITIYEQKNSLKKALQFLVSKRFMADTPQEIASFLRVYKNSFDPSAIGDFLGEGGLNPREEEYWSQIRFRYTRAVSFVEMELEPALRLYLTGCGFRLPGEAQKIDRFVEVFQKTYWADNHGTQNCPLKHADTVHLLTFAIIMLNTDLHRANGDKKKRKRMTKEEFINNLRGGDKGDNIDRDYLSRIYDNIAAQPIEMAVEQSEAKADAAATAHMSRSSVGGSAAASAAAPAASTAGGGDRASTGRPNQAAHDFSAAEEKAFLKEIARNIRDSEDLLRSLSPFTYGFHLTGVDTKMSLDLVSFMYETVWFHFNAITEALLGEQRYDISVTVAALDILCYSLTSAIFLDIKVERHAFATQLLKFQESCIAESRNPSPSLLNCNWFSDLETSVPETAMETIAGLHKLIVVLKDSLHEISNYELTRQVAAKIEKKAKVLESNSFFVREGDLGKRSRTGRVDLYRFFLFSDYLIYCHQGMMSGEYKVHEQLSLADMMVSDVDDPTGCSLYITHPTKSFVIVADSQQSKHNWLRDIDLAITSCIKRQDAQKQSEGRRKLSIVDRIEGQQQLQNEEHARRTILSPGLEKPKTSSGAKTLTPFQGRDPSAGSEEGPKPSVLFALTDDGEDLGSSSAPSTPLAAAKPDLSPLPAAPLTPKDKASKDQEAIATFKALLQDLPEKKLASLFFAGTTFWRGMVESRGGGGLKEADKLRLYGLHKQAKSGPAGDVDVSSVTSTPTRVRASTYNTLASAHATQIIGTSVRVSSKHSSEASDDSSGAGAGGAASGADDIIPPPVTLSHSTSVGAVMSTSRGEPSAAMQLEAWKACEDMSMEDAKKEFLIALYTTAPYWKYEKFL